MSKSRRTETPAPLRTDDGGLLLSPPVCGSCRCRPVRVVKYTDGAGKEAYRASTSCAECQRGAFGGGSPAPVAAVVEVAPTSETQPAPRPVVPLTSDETITALAASVERVAAPPSVTAADLSRHAVRMRKAGLPVDELDPHERREMAIRRSRRSLMAMVSTGLVSK